MAVFTPLPHPAAYTFLKELRLSKNASLKPTSMLRKEILGFDGKPQEFKLRYYQVQGIYHLLSLKRMVLGDGTGLGKTVEVVAFLAYFWGETKGAKGKAIVLAPKSALRQWASEIARFATGMKTFVVTGSPAARRKVYEAWRDHPVGPGEDHAILISNYHSVVGDWNAGSTRPLLPNGQPDPKVAATPGLLDRITAGTKDLIVIFDEATAFKNGRTKTWQVCSQLSDRASRVYGLTATLLKNRLEEGYHIYKCIYSPVFGNKTWFLNQFCVTKMQSVSNRRQIPIILGYKNLQAFRDLIDPYFLGRPKHVVSDELPKLITKQVMCEMLPAEVAKYYEALTGVLELGDGEVKDYEEHKAFVALNYCQQICDSLSLLKFEGGDTIMAGISFDPDEHEVTTLGSKEQALLDLFDDELEGEKTILYTRFSSLVPRLQEILKGKGIKSVVISGDVVDTEKHPRRKMAADAFNKEDSGVQVVIITDAGSEAINLQSASFMVFYDAPWSWGGYLQLLGRPIRIGSPHQNVVAIHLVSEIPSDTPKESRTIDHYTLALLMKKKDLIDKVLGESAVGALDFGGSGSSFKKELLRMLKEKRE